MKQIKISRFAFDELDQFVIFYSSKTSSNVYIRRTTKNIRMKNKIAVSKFILSKPYHGKSKFSTNFQTWVQKFF
jgi:hypothetical protein